MKIFSNTILASTLFLAACGGGGEAPEDTTIEKKKVVEKKEKPQAVTSIKVKKQDFVKTVEVHGFVESGNNITVVPEINGIIRSINVREGQAVTRGTVLARLDTEILYKNKEELKTQLELAEEIFKKQKSLYDSKVGSEVQYLQAKTNKESLEQRIRTIDSQIGKAIVRAPISGRVDKIFPKQGEMASVQMPLARIINTNSGAYVECDVSEAYYRKVQKGDSVQITFPTFGDEKLKTVISYKSNFIDNSNRTFKIQANLDTKNKDYPANLFAIVELILEKKEGQVIVPTDIVQRSGNVSFVYKVGGKNGSRAIKQPVKLALSYDNQSVISEGLNEGDEVITKAVWSKLISLNDKGVLINTGTNK